MYLGTQVHPPVPPGVLEGAAPGSRPLLPPPPSCPRGQRASAQEEAGKRRLHAAVAASCCPATGCRALRAWPGGWGPGCFLGLETRCNWQPPEVSAAWPSKEGRRDSYGELGLWETQKTRLWVWSCVCKGLRAQRVCGWFRKRPR